LVHRSDGLAGYCNYCPDGAEAGSTVAASRVRRGAGGVIGNADNYATTFNSYYDITVIMMSDMTRKPAKAIANRDNTEYVNGVTTSQLSGANLYKVYFDEGGFILKQNQGYTAFYPQICAFAQSDSATVKDSSLQSVTTTLLSGEGGENNPYNIINEADMKALSLLTRQTDTEGTYFRVYSSQKTFDLSDSDLSFVSIGNSDSPFNGCFDGNNAVFVLNINTPVNYQGLFGYIGESAIVKDFAVEGNVYGGAFTGAIAGYNKGLIINASAAAEVSGMDNTGGLAGCNEGVITNSHYEGKVTGSGNYTGGIAGVNKGEITYSYNMGPVFSLESYVGGITGKNESEGVIITAFNHGGVKSNKLYASGIASINDGSIEMVYNTANITALTGYASGLVVRNGGVLNTAYHSGLIMTAEHAAGITVINDGALQKAYYNISETDRLLGTSYMLITSAVYNCADTEDVKGLTLYQMTGADAIDEEKINFDAQYWACREGYDFISYFPEMLYFRNHENEIVREHSLISVTDKKFEGEGTEKYPYLIYDGYDMNTIHEFVVKGQWFTNKHFKVADGVTVIDLTLWALNYQPIGDVENYFDGILDGKGANFILDIDYESQDYLGIFHTLGSSAKIKDLFVSGQVIGRSYIGGVAGRCFGEIDNVVNYAEIKSFAGNNVGGITGFNEGTIKNSSNKGNINMEGTYAGAIAGENLGTIIGCYNKAAVNGVTNVGGIAGRNFASIKDSYNAGEITSETQSGGITGENCGLVSGCFNMGVIRATVGIAGGISGAQRYKGSGANPDMYIVYNTGKVLSSNSIAGGILGHLLAGRLMDAYNGGDINALNEAGAIVGHLENGNVSRCYYDINRLENYNPVTGIKPVRAIGNAEDDGTVKGLYRGQMAGAYSIGNKANQMNFYYPSSFINTPSYDKWSFYPQIRVFADSAVEEVRNDSLESVRGLTFIVGEGSQENPYIIMNESDIIALAETVNSGNEYEGVYFIVHPSIVEFNFYDEDGYPYSVIGTVDHAFKGDFNGNGVNFNINLIIDKDYTALFGHIGEGGKAYGFSVSGNIAGANCVAAVAALNEGLIKNVYNQAAVTGKDYTAGIAAINRNEIINVYNKGEINGWAYTGGISAYIDGYVTNSYNIGVVYGRSEVGAIAGFLNTGLILYSYYDTRVLRAYRDLGNNIKPIRAVGNSEDSETVKGLDKRFMIGVSAIGDGDLQMNFMNNDWGVNYNIDGQENYPQLRVFSRSVHDTVKERSKQSTLTTLYTVTYDYNGATENNTTPYSYVMNGYHYGLVVPFKYGFEFTGWHYYNANQELVRYTDSQGLSLAPYAHEENITLIAQWEVAYHLVQFIDGNNRVVYSQSVLHGDYIQPPQDIIPEKSPSYNYIYIFEEWDFDFDSRITEKINIYAKFKAIDRYYKITYLDGNNNFFKEVKVEYGQKTQPVTDIPAKQFVGNTAYRFIAWDFDFEIEIYENHIITPIFEEVYRWYTVRFYNYDYTLLDEQIVEFMQAAFPPLTPPQRQPDIDTVYVFSGWDKEFDCVTENLDVFALYDEETRYYEVIFIDGNGKRFNTQYIEYGQPAAEPPGMPRKDPYGNEAYRFIGWDKDFDCIVEDTVITAQFEAIDRYYEVMFVNYDGTVILSQTVEYTFSATPPQETPQREPDNKFVYIFIGWDKPYDCIMEDTVITAVYEMALRPFSVKFIDGDGNIFNEQTVLYGQDASLPQGIPTKSAEGDFAFKFVGWVGQYTNITADTEIFAEFEPVQRYYFVTFYGYDLSLVLKSERVEYGHSATPPQPPIPQHSNIAYEYYFDGWDTDFGYVVSDLTVKAIYKSRIKTFEVTFVNGDETVTQIVNYGQDAVPPVPYKTGDDRVSYTFVEWDTDFTNVTEDLIVTAIFEADYKYFLVTFINGDGSVLEVQRVNKGQDATPPSSPYKPKTETKVYVFSGWDRTFTDVQSDITVYSLFVEYDRYYEVVFNDAFGAPFSIQQVEYALSAIEPDIPQKPCTDKFEYVFIDWDKDFGCVTSSLVINPLYEEQLRRFNVVFIDGDDKIINTQTVVYGYSASAPSSASKSPSSDKCYVFDGWEGDYSYVTCDMEIRALFVEVDRWYTVTFVGQNEEVLNVQIVEYQKSAYDPIRYLDYQIVNDMYIFAVVGWDKPFDNIVCDLTVNAIYDTISRWYTVRFYNYDNTLLKEETVEYGHAASPPQEDPVREGDDDYVYIFDGWDKEFDFVMHDMAIYAVYAQYENNYTVRFYDGDGQLFDEQTVGFGKDACPPDGIPTKTPTAMHIYVFIGWDAELTNIRDHRVINAVFKEQIRYYTVTFVDNYGNLLKEEQVVYGGSATPPQGIVPPEPNEQYYYEVAWIGDYTNIVKDVEIRLVFEAITREYTYIFLGADGEIIKKVVAPYGTEIVPPNAPHKPMTEKYVYTFIDWYPDVDPILTRDVVYEPCFEESIREYTVTFLDGDDNIFEVQYVPYGSNGVLPQGIPQKTPTKQYYYEFKKWEAYPNSIRSDTVIRPIFNQFLQLYKVTFVDEQDNILKIQLVEYGSGATEPSPDLIPKKADTQMYIYTFVGWSRPFSYVVEDITVKTVYIQELRCYTYTFYDEDRVTILKQVRAPYNSQIIPPPNPTKQAQGQTQYRFVGWDKVVADKLIEDVDYYAVYEEIPITFTVTFYDGDGFVISVQVVNYGQSAQTPDIIPTKTMNRVYEYVFEGWIEDYSVITTNLEVHPKFKEQLRKYTVRFINYDNSAMEALVEYGKSAEGLVPTPVRKGYRFYDWDKDISVITEDMDVYAIFAPNNYQINFHPENADTGYMSPIVRQYDSQVALPLNEFSRRGYHFVGWEERKPSGETVYYHDGQQFVLQEEGMDLYARWLPILYSIVYHLNGGTAINPENYTIEDHIVLQSAYKEDHRFIGWFLTPPQDSSFNPMSMMSISICGMGIMMDEETPDLPLDRPIEAIPQGTIGNLELYAAYEFDGYLTLKEGSELYFVMAEGAYATRIEERTHYDENNPVFLKGTYKGMTVAEVRSNFINNDFTILRANGNVAEETDAIGTGWKIVIYDEEGNIRDCITVVLLGDLDGNGIVNANDLVKIKSHLKDPSLAWEYLLAANINEDGVVNAIDYNLFKAMLK